MGNISALWEEVNQLRQEVNYHLHDNHAEDHHDEVREKAINIFLITLIGEGLLQIFLL